jgi:hypothetical protein
VSGPWAVGRRALRCLLLGVILAGIVAMHGAPGTGDGMSLVPARSAEAPSSVLPGSVAQADLDAGMPGHVGMTSTMTAMCVSTQPTPTAGTRLDPAPLGLGGSLSGLGFWSGHRAVSAAPARLARDDGGGRARPEVLRI